MLISPYPGFWRKTNGGRAYVRERCQCVAEHFQQVSQKCAFTTYGTRHLAARPQHEYLYRSLQKSLGGLLAQWQKWQRDIVISGWTNPVERRKRSAGQKLRRRPRNFHRNLKRLAKPRPLTN